jgi:hypothetical protein
VRDWENRARYVVEDGAIGWGWRILILFGVLVGLGGVYWAYNLH